MTDLPKQGTDTDVTLLHVDTGEGIIERVEELLERDLGTISIQTVTDPEKALTHLDSTDIDCVLSGTEMAEMESLDFLERVRDVRSDVPFIFYETDETEDYVTEAISIGANDVIHPAERTDRAELLTKRITNLVDQYRTHQQLQESNRRFETLVSNLPGMVYRCKYESEWPMLFVSDGCEQLTGYDADALVDGTVSYGEDIVASGDVDDVWQIVTEAIENGNPFQCDYQVVTAEGERKWVWEQGRGVEFGGDVVAIEGFVTDITDRKQQTQRLNVLNRVLRHNLRNRMSVILSHAAGVEEQVADETLKARTDQIRQTAHEVAALSESVTDIEEILQLSPAEFYPVDLHRLVETVAADRRTAYPDATVTVDAESPLWVEATEKLQLVVHHALDNALAHNDGESPSGHVLAATGDDEGMVRLDIADDGPGIDPVELNVLDEHESITDLSHGSGLGLWVMKWYVDAVDGDLTFSDHDPRGTVVTIRLPAAEPPDGR